MTYTIMKKGNREIKIYNHNELDSYTARGYEVLEERTLESDRKTNKNQADTSKDRGGQK